MQNLKNSLSCAFEPTGDCGKKQVLTPKVGVGPKIPQFSEFPGDAYTASPQTTLNGRCR